MLQQQAQDGPERAHKFIPSLLFYGDSSPYLRLRISHSLCAHAAQSSTMCMGGTLCVSRMVSPGWPVVTRPGLGTASASNETADPRVVVVVVVGGWWSDWKIIKTKMTVEETLEKAVWPAMVKWQKQHQLLNCFLFWIPLT